MSHTKNDMLISMELSWLLNYVLGIASGGPKCPRGLLPFLNNAAALRFDHWLLLVVLASTSLTTKFVKAHEHNGTSSMAQGAKLQAQNLNPGGHPLWALLVGACMCEGPMMQ